MNVTRNMMRKVLAPGDTVYIIAPGKVIPAKVLEICEDSLETDADTLFYDEHGFTWMLTEKEAEKMALKSQKNVLNW